MFNMDAIAVIIPSLSDFIKKVSNIQSNKDYINWKSIAKSFIRIFVYYVYFIDLQNCKIRSSKTVFCRFCSSSRGAVRALFFQYATVFFRSYVFTFFFIFSFYKVGIWINTTATRVAIIGLYGYILSFFHLTEPWNCLLVYKRKYIYST